MLVLRPTQGLITIFKPSQWCSIKVLSCTLNCSVVINACLCFIQIFPVAVQKFVFSLSTSSPSCNVVEEAFKRYQIMISKLTMDMKLKFMYVLSDKTLFFFVGCVKISKMFLIDLCVSINTFVAGVRDTRTLKSHIEPQFSCHLQLNNPPVNCAKGLLKPLKDWTSLLVCNENKFFKFWVFLGDIISSVSFRPFWLWLPGLGPQLQEGSILLRF